MVEIINSVNSIEADKEAIIDLELLVNTEEGFSSHRQIHEALGVPEEIRKEIYNALDHGHIKHAFKTDRALWSHPIEHTFEKYASTAQEIIGQYDVIEPSQEHSQKVKGAKEFISELKEAGYETCILSPDPKAVTRPVAEELGADLVYRWKDYEFGGDECRFYLNPEGRYGKNQIIEKLQEKGVEVAYFENEETDLSTPHSDHEEYQTVLHEATKEAEI